MITLSTEEIWQKYMPHVLQMTRGLIKNEIAAAKITDLVFHKFEEKSKSVKWLDEKTVRIYLSLTARTLCTNYLNQPFQNVSRVEPESN